MFFLKPKHKISEILPPPPPFPTLDLEEESTGLVLEKPKFSDEIIDVGGSNEIPEVREFDNLVRELDDYIKPNAAKPSKTVKEKKLTKSQLKKQKSYKKSGLKQLGVLFQPITSKKAENKNAKVSPVDEDFAIDNPDFKIPDKLGDESMDFPENLGDFGVKDNSINSILKETLSKPRPKELEDAEDEINSAIESIKKQEKPSILRRLFKSKEKIPEIQVESMVSDDASMDDISMIQSSIKNARDALAKFDLESAKKEYLKVMGIYNNLGPEEKSKVYNDIREIYNERKSAEKLKS